MCHVYFDHTNKQTVTVYLQMEHLFKFWFIYGAIYCSFVHVKAAYDLIISCVMNRLQLRTIYIDIIAYLTILIRLQWNKFTIIDRPGEQRVWINSLSTTRRREVYCMWFVRSTILYATLAEQVANIARFKVLRSVI